MKVLIFSLFVMAFLLLFHMQLNPLNRLSLGAIFYVGFHSLLSSIRGGIVEGSRGRRGSGQ